MLIFSPKKTKTVNRKQTWIKRKYRMKNKFFLSLIVLLTFICTLPAQRATKTEANADLVEYTSRDGLPTTSITKIVQTNDGYLWISGKEGTYRFDGYNFDEVCKEYGVPRMQNVHYDSTENMLYFASPKKFITFNGSVFKVYSEKDGYKINGLPGQNIMLLKQDSKGRIWIGSATSFIDHEYNGGLTKFENGSFTVYDSTSFPLHNALNFIETPYGDLIFSSKGKNTQNGQDAYIALYKDDKFQRIDQKYGVNLLSATIYDQDIVNAIDNEGNTWIAFYGRMDRLFNPIKNTTGVLMYDGKTFHQFPGLKTNLYFGQGVASVAYSKADNTIYCTTYFNFKRVNNFNPVFELKNKEWIPSDFVKDMPIIKNLKTNESIKDFRFFNSMYSKSNKYFPELLNLVSTSTRGESTKYPHQIFNRNNGKWGKFDAFSGNFAGELNDGYLINTLKGFSIYNPDKSKMFTENNGLLYAETIVPQLYPDKNGLVWISYSYTKHISYLDIQDIGINVWDGTKLRSITTKDGLASNTVFEVLQDSKERLWITTSKGVTRVKEIKNNEGEWLFKLENIPSDKTKSYNTTRIIETKNGDIFTWQSYTRSEDREFGHSQFYLGRLAGYRFIEMESPFGKEIKEKNQFYDLIETNEGQLLLLGVFADDIKEITSAETKIKVYENGQWSDPPETWKQPRDQLNYVGTLQNGTYFLTVGGFYNFDGQQFVNLSDSVNADADFRILKSASVAGTYTNIQAGEWLYIRLRQRGLVAFDGTHLNFHTMKDGLPSTNLYNPSPDINGNLMFSHPSGSVLIRGGKFQSFYDDESIVTGGSNSAALDGDGNVVMFYRGVGLYIKSLEHQSYPLRISSVSVDTSTWFYNYPKVFSYSENSILINYAALNFRDPKGTNYEHILEGYESEWSRPGNLSFSEYQNLAAGDYVFRVRGTTSSGVKTNEVSYAFKIHPPLWATWWAYLLYVLGFCLILLGVRRFEQTRMRKKQEIKFEKERAAAQVKEAELKAKATEAERKALEIENERKTKELEEARALQLSMLPQEVPQHPNLEIAVYMKTATEVGGDYYDFSVLDDGSLNVAIGDATGHGMKAGTLVSAMKALFTAESMKLDIESFFISANTALKKMKMERILMGFAMLNIKDNHIKMVNAGMPPVFIYRKGLQKIEEINLHSIPLGAMKNSKYNSITKNLETGDTLLLMSDGMPELENDNKDIFGYDRISRKFEEVAEQTGKDIINHLTSEGNKWLNSQTQKDDVTFVVVKLK